MLYFYYYYTLFSHLVCYQQAYFYHDVHFLFLRVEPGTPSYNEPKFIVFFSMLLSLFTMVCFKCKKSKPAATMKQRVTMVIVSQHCPKCGENWRSQPQIFGNYPAANILLSFGVLLWLGPPSAKSCWCFGTWDLFIRRASSSR